MSTGTGSNFFDFGKGEVTPNHNATATNQVGHGSSDANNSSMKGGKRFKKGSKAAKDFMAKLRAMRDMKTKKHSRKMNNGGEPMSNNWPAKGGLTPDEINNLQEELNDVNTTEERKEEINRMLSGSNGGNPLVNNNGGRRRRRRGKKTAKKSAKKGGRKSRRHSCKMNN